MSCGTQDVTCPVEGAEGDPDRWFILMTSSLFRRIMLCILTSVKDHYLGWFDSSCIVHLTGYWRWKYNLIISQKETVSRLIFFLIILMTVTKEWQQTRPFVTEKILLIFSLWSQMKAVLCCIWKLPLVLPLSVIESLLNPTAPRDIGISVLMAQIFKKDFFLVRLSRRCVAYFGYV